MVTDYAQYLPDTIPSSAAEANQLVHIEVKNLTTLGQACVFIGSTAMRQCVGENWMRELGLAEHILPEPCSAEASEEWPAVVAATIKLQLEQLGLEIHEEHTGTNPFLTSCTLSGQVRCPAGLPFANINMHSLEPSSPTSQKSAWSRRSSKSSNNTASTALEMERARERAAYKALKYLLTAYSGAWLASTASANAENTQVSPMSRKKWLSVAAKSQGEAKAALKALLLLDLEILCGCDSPISYDGDSPFSEHY